MSAEAKQQERVLVAIASYNERETLPSLLDAIFRVETSADVLVIDDSSPDGTGDYLDHRAKDEPRLLVMQRAGKLGLGTAILASFKYAVSHQYDLLVGLDADWSHPPEKIPELIEATQGPNGCDVAIASRYVKGGGVEGWPLRRRLSSAMVNTFARIVLGLPVRDCSGGFRCFRVAKLAPVVEVGLRSGGYAIFEEVLLRLAENGATFKEIPFTFCDRTQGKSKLSLREVAKAISTLVSLAADRLTRSRRRTSAGPR